MRIVWESQATEGKERIADYIFERFGYDRMESFYDDVNRTAEMIEDHPASGPIDPLFTDRQKAYRSVIVGGLSKMVYSVEEDAIHILAFWDCRQEPERQTKQVVDNEK